MRFQAMLKGIAALFTEAPPVNKGKLHVPAVESTSTAAALRSLIGIAQPKRARAGRERLGRRRNFRKLRASRNAMAAASRKANRGRL